MYHGGRKWPCGTGWGTFWPLVDIVGLAIALAGDLVYAGLLATPPRSPFFNSTLVLRMQFLPHACVHNT